MEKIVQDHVIINEKKLYIEFLRIVAAFFVIVNHVYNPLIYFTSISKSWYASVIFLFVSKIAVPIFLMISGNLLLNKKDDKNRYFTRILKWICVIIVFSTVYYFYYHQHWNFTEYLHCIIGSATFAFWYLYLYLGILLMLPILQKLANVLSKNELQLLIIISIFISGILPFFSIFTTLNIENELIEVLFSPYLGMMFMGYYIERYLIINKKIVIGSSCLFIGLILIQVFLTRKLYDFNNQNYMQLDNRILLTVTLSAICIYILVKYLFEKVNVSLSIIKLIKYIGSLTFGIFLFGDMFINLLMPFFNKYGADNNIFIRLLVLSIGAFLGSAICTAILKRIPIIKKLL